VGACARPFGGSWINVFPRRYFLIPDFPEDTTWLTHEEKEWVQNRLQEDVGKSGLEQPIKIRDLKVIFTDYKVCTAHYRLKPSVTDKCHAQVHSRSVDVLLADSPRILIRLFRAHDPPGLELLWSVILPLPPHK